MKVYFTSSITGLDQFRPNCEKVSELLKKYGNTVVEEFLHINKKEDIAYTANKSGYVYDFITKQIKNSDVFIGEMSYRSAPVSYQLTFALDHNKPCLYLYEKDKGSKVHAVFKGNPSKYLVVKEYKIENLEKIIKDFLDLSKKLMMRRFNFFLPAELDEYLAVKSAITGISKGEYLRKLIEKEKGSDKQFDAIKNSM